MTYTRQLRGTHMNVVIEFTIGYVLVSGMPPTFSDCVQYSINTTRLPSNRMRLRSRGECYYMVRVNQSQLIGRQASILMGEKGDHSCCVRSAYGSSQQQSSTCRKMDPSQVEQLLVEKILLIHRELHRIQCGIGTIQGVAGALTFIWLLWFTFLILLRESYNYASMVCAYRSMKSVVENVVTLCTHNFNTNTHVNRLC